MKLWLRHPREADLALFAGGELGPVARWRIEGHVNGCDDCRQAVCEFFELRSKVMDLAEMPQLDWAELAAGIHRRVEQTRIEPRVRPVWRPAWSAALALLALVAAGAYVSQLRMAGGGTVLDASAGGVELRVGSGKVLTLMNGAQQGTQGNWRVSADAVSVRYLDKETGNITVSNVYAE